MATALQEASAEVENVHEQAGETRSNLERATAAVSLVAQQLEQGDAGMQQLLRSTAAGDE